MAATDAEMPDHKALNDDLKKIAAHIAKLRAEIDGLAGTVGETGSHQAEALRDQAAEALESVKESVRREPLRSLAIAAGIGFVLGIVMGR